MALTKEELKEFQEKELRNPQVDFTGEQNLAVQTGYLSIQQQMADFERAGQAIMVANSDRLIPELPGLPAYPDPIETILLQREVDAELLIARRRLLMQDELNLQAAKLKAEHNESELNRIKRAESEAAQANATTTPKA